MGGRGVFEHGGALVGVKGEFPVEGRVALGGVGWRRTVEGRWERTACDGGRGGGRSTVATGLELAGCGGSRTFVM